MKINPSIYFDCNATTPVLPSAAKVTLSTMEMLYGNPSSTHSAGLQARHILESSRKICADVIGADAEQIIFTSGATEAIQMAIFSVLQASKTQIKDGINKLLYSATEHKVIPQALRHWVNVLDLPYEIVELPVDRQGQIVLDKLREELPSSLLVCTMAVNNETGVIQNLSSIEEIIQAYHPQVFWLVDSVQALGKVDLKLKTSRIDYATFSGHKFYAPKGIGFLYSKAGAPVTPFIVGGGQEKNLRSGTENLPGIAALGHVLKLFFLENDHRDIFRTNSVLINFRDKLIDELKAIFPTIVFNTPFDQAIPTTINFSVPGFTSSELLDVFDASGLRMSGGSACSSSSSQQSYVLDAMGASHSVSSSAVRLSIGACTTADEIEQGCHLLRECGIALNKTYLLSSNTSIGKSSHLQDGIIQFRVGASNTWIITDNKSKTCIIIDPCEEILDRIEQYVLCHDFTVLAVLDTHAHADHESIRPVLQIKLLSRFISHSSIDCDELGWPNKNSNSCIVKLENNDVVSAIRIRSLEDGDLVLAKLPTPGHTSDSLTYLLGIQKYNLLKSDDIKSVFSGDMILSGGLGRTNFISSNVIDMYESIKKLYSIINEFTPLFPAHDYNYSFVTNYSTEKKNNPLMRLALESSNSDTLNEFRHRKINMDEELAELEKSFQGVVCGVTKTRNCDENQNIMLNFDSLSDYLHSKIDTPLVVNVSEEQESHLVRDWDVMGFTKPPVNIPLSNLSDLLLQLLKSKSFDKEILFICRSGDRSLQAVKAFRHLGFNSVWNLSGGIALAKANNLLYLHRQQ